MLFMDVTNNSLADFSPPILMEFDELVKTIKDSPEYDPFKPLEQSELMSCFEELIWQAFYAGLKVSRCHDPIKEFKCSFCNNGITETVDGKIIDHDLAIEEGWFYDFDKEEWLCFDCK